MNAYVGLGPLVRLAARRDRVTAALALFVLAGFCYASAAATPQLFPDAEQRAAAVHGINGSGAIVALYGPILAPRSLGDIAMSKMTVLYAAFAALYLVFLVRRHTRSEEETGTAELVGGTAVGHAAPQTAALLFGAAFSLVLGGLVALVDVAGGLEVTGSLAFGAVWAGTGLVAVGWAALACQLSTSARTCAAIASGGLAAAFLVRAVGDTRLDWLGWFSPLGWNTRLRAWDHPRWWVLLLYAGLAAILVVAAQLLRARRDLGGGFVAERPGPASSTLGSPAGLAWRLHRTMLTTWAAVTVVFGAVMGAIVPGIGDLVKGTAAEEMFQRLGGEGFIERTMIAAELGIAAIVVSCFSVAVVVHAGQDERAGRTEEVLAGPVSRRQLFAGVAGVALAGPAVLLLLTGLSLGLAYGQDVGDVVTAALCQLPAVWVVAAVVLLAWGGNGRAAVAGWGVVIGLVFLDTVAELLDWPTWVGDVSPYRHVPKVPAEGFAATPLVLLTLVAGGVLAAAVAAYRSRDIG